MSMIVARMVKMKSENLIGIGNHNQRKTENHSNKDIDITKSDLNYDLVNLTENYKTDIENFINKNKSSSRALRKDAVLINEWIVTSDKKFFKNLSEKEIKDFFVSTKEYFGNVFGEENIRYATVHLDESTPHLHMGIVPFDKDKKLSAKRVFNRESLRNVQDNLPKYLQEKGFEIKRGLEGSERKNLTVKEFKDLKIKEKEIETEIEKKKNELKSYLMETKIDNKIDVMAKKEMKEVEVKIDEKTFFGKNRTKVIKKWTGNVVISEKDFFKMKKFIANGRKKEQQLNEILETDVHRENKELRLKLSSKTDENSKNISDYNRLVGKYNNLLNENTLLRNDIDDLKTEIGLIYKSTKNIIKEHTDDFKAIFKSLSDDIYTKTKNFNLKSNFKKEFDLDNKKNRTRGMDR